MNYKDNLTNQYFNTSDGKKIFVQTTFDKNKGSNKPVILFNYGLVCSNHHWSKQIDYFYTKGFDLILHDYRGHFNSSGADDLKSITFNQFALDINHILEQLHCKKVHMFGHSMGVNVSLEFAKLFAEKIDRMVLIGGTVFPVTEVMFNSNVMELVIPLVHKLLEKYPQAASKFWKTTGLNPLVQAIIMSGGFNQKQVSMDFIQVYLNRVALLSPELFMQLYHEMTVHDILAYLEQIKTPSLIVGGEKDKVIPFQLQRVLHSKLVNSKLYMVKEGSHVPQVDFPEQVNERMLLFIENGI